MGSSSRAATLLSLPRELRDQIYSYLVESHWAPDRVLQSSSFKTIHGQLHFPSEYAKWQPFRIQYVNKQFYSEVQDFIATHRRTHGVPLALTIDIRGFMYTPTWTHLTYTLQPSDKQIDLHVTLVINTTEAFRRNDGWPRQPGQGFRSLLNILNRFMVQGPSFLDFPSAYRTPGPHFVQCLHVHVEFRDHYTMNTWAETVQEIFRCCKALSRLDIAHEYLGKVKCSSKYERRGEIVERAAEWEVQQGQWTATETEWAAEGFWLGEQGLGRTTDDFDSSEDDLVSPRRQPALRH